MDFRPITDNTEVTFTEEVKTWGVDILVGGGLVGSCFSLVTTGVAGLDEGILEGAGEGILEGAGEGILVTAGDDDLEETGELDREEDFWILFRLSKRFGFRDWELACPSSGIISIPSSDSSSTRH